MVDTAVRHANTSYPANSASGDRSPVSLITMYLDPCESHPNGSRGCGYQILAPVDAVGNLDADSWPRVRDACIVRRFWEGEPDACGHLTHRAPEASTRSWCFSYRRRADMDDEVIEGEDAIITRGTCVSVNGPRGRHSFRVAEVLQLERPH